MIVVLDTLRGDMHGALFLGKFDKLLFLAMSIFSSCNFYHFLESNLIVDLILYLRTSLEDLSMLWVSLNSEDNFFLEGDWTFGDLVW
jgi:hypothetical protein